MNVRNPKFLICIFVIFGLGVRYVDSCLLEYSDASEKAHGMLRDAVKKFNTAYKGEIGSHYYNKKVLLLQTAVNKAEGFFSTALQLLTNDILCIEIRKYFPTGMEGNLSIWFVQGMAINYAASFTEGYMKYVDDPDPNVQRKANACQQMATYLTAFATYNFNTKKVSERIIQKHSLFLEDQKERDRAEMVLMQQTTLSSSLRKIYGPPYIYKNLEKMKWHVPPLGRRVHICSFFGKLLYGNDQKRDDLFIDEEKLWNDAERLFALIENSVYRLADALLAFEEVAFTRKIAEGATSAEGNTANVGSSTSESSTSEKKIIKFGSFMVEIDGSGNTAVIDGNAEKSSEEAEENLESSMSEMNIRTETEESSEE